MRIEASAGDRAVTTELGRRVAQHRLAQNVSQSQLAARAGIGVATLHRLEHGSPVDLTTFIRVLRALGRLDEIDAVLPELTVSPLEQLALHGRRRRRARAAGGAPGGERKPWRWGDEADEAAGGDGP
jgi:transcriptional regulator with XRE-family HTH domain